MYLQKWFYKFSRFKKYFLNFLNIKNLWNYKKKIESNVECVYTETKEKNYASFN